MVGCRAGGGFLWMALDMMYLLSHIQSRSRGQVNPVPVIVP